MTSIGALASLSNPSIASAVGASSTATANTKVAAASAANSVSRGSDSVELSPEIQSLLGNFLSDSGDTSSKSIGQQLAAVLGTDSTTSSDSNPIAGLLGNSQQSSNPISALLGDNGSSAINSLLGEASGGVTQQVYAKLVTSAYSGAVAKAAAQIQSVDPLEQTLSSYHTALQAYNSAATASSSASGSAGSGVSTSA